MPGYWPDDPIRHWFRGESTKSIKKLGSPLALTACGLHAYDVWFTTMSKPDDRVTCKECTQIAQTDPIYPKVVNVMTCRHAKGDPNCSSNQSSYSEPSTTKSTTPDATKYNIIKVREVLDKHLVLEVQYPNCKSCEYEGRKIMVFLNTRAIEALRWREIDPHFRKPGRTESVAPSPDARFPASTQGWDDANAYASSKVK